MIQFLGQNMRYKKSVLDISNITFPMFAWCVKDTFINEVTELVMIFLTQLPSIRGARGGVTLGM